MGTFTKSIVASECIGDSLVTINNNFANIDLALQEINKSVVAINKSLNAVIEDNKDDIEASDIATLLDQNDLKAIQADINELNKKQFVDLKSINKQIQVAEQSSVKLEDRLKKYINDVVAIPTHYDESTFVYGKPIEGIEVPGLTNRWQNVFKSPAKEPVEVIFTTTKFRRKALVHAGIYVSLIDKWSSMWTRVWNDTDNKAVAWGSQEGHVQYSEGNLIPMHKVVTLKPNTKYRFRLQTYIPQWKGGVVVNGFHTPGRSPQTLNANFNTNQYKRIFAEDPPRSNSTGITAPGNPEVRNVSFLQVVLI
jgi:hypothetical protein